MIDLQQFLTNNTKLPTREKRSLEDLLLYKQHIICLRNNTENGFYSLITYIKKSTQQVKQYQIDLYAYYFNRYSNQFVLLAKNNMEQTKTFLLKNILKVQQGREKNKKTLYKLN